MLVVTLSIAIALLELRDVNVGPLKLAAFVAPVGPVEP